MCRPEVPRGLNELIHPTAEKTSHLHAMEKTQTGTFICKREAWVVYDGQ